MARDDLLAELRDLADCRSALLRKRIVELSAHEAAEALAAFVALDASYRAAGVPATEEPMATSAGPGELARALDHAASVSDALASIEDLDGLLRGVFDALSEAEVRLLVFERAFRVMFERGAAER